MLSVILLLMEKIGVKPVQFGLVMFLNLTISLFTPQSRMARPGGPSYGMKTRLRAGQ